MASIRVAFCCNDERGHFTGKVEGVDFSDSRGFEARLSRGAGIRFDLDGTPAHRVKVGRRLFEIAPGSVISGYGNWCWDAVSMSRGEALRLLAYLLTRDFDVEEYSLEGPFARVVQQHKRRAS
jgi:hypothetical protein